MARKKSRWNIGTIVFLVLLIYVLINVMIFVGKEKLTVYKVTEDKILSTYSHRNRPQERETFEGRR